MRLLILLLILGVGVVFFVQNPQPVTLVFFGNLASFTLPIAGWVLLFTGAGTLTSLFWRVLIPSRKPSSANFNAPRSRPYSSVPPPEPPPNPRTPFDYEDYRPPQEQPRSQQTVTPPPVQPEWRKREEAEEWDDWEDTEPAPEKTREPIRDFVREVTRKSDREKVKELIFPEDPEEERKPPTESDSSPEETPSDRPLEPESKSTIFEVEQQPKITNRTGSVYSYVYREPRQAPKQPEVEEVEEREKTQNKENRRDRVYDADYRVIRPPYKENTEPSSDRDDDEDWV
jgi:hypothetical protein